MQFVDLRNPPASSRPKVLMRPYERNPYFLGRDDLLIHLRQKLEETKPKQYNHRVAIFGMGGVGKTQVANEYIYRYEKHYNDIYWISATDESALLSGFEEIGSKTGCLGERTELTSMQVDKAVLSWLEMQANWLLIVDNLDVVSVAKGLLPKVDTGGHTLITTQNPNAKNIPAEGFEIPLLGQSDAINLLRIKSEMTEAEIPDFTTVATDIVHELGCLALAIDHATAYIRSSPTLKVIEFLPIYYESRKRILARPSDREYEYPNSVAATFLLSLDKVRSDPQCGTQAAILLRLFAFLNPDEIQIEFLKAGRAGLGDEIRQIIESRYTLHGCLALLQQFSLIGRSQNKESLVIHRLIQAVLKDELSAVELEQYSDEAIGLCSAAFPQIGEEHEKRELGRRFQGQVVEPAIEAAKIPSIRAAIALRQISRFLEAEGKWKDEERMIGRSYEILRILLGNEHQETLTSMSNLALTYRNQGKLNKAAALQERELEARKRTLGEEHPGTLTSMNNMAITYQSQGKLNEAAALQERVLEATKRTLGEEHPDTLRIMNNLALTYQGKGKLNEAAALQERVLEATKRTLGEEHPDTLTSMNNLAITYQSQGKLNEAAALEERVLEAGKRTLGEEHPHTLTSMSNLALAYQGQGKLNEAAALQERVLEARKRTLGEEHPDTLTSMSNLALAYHD